MNPKNEWLDSEGLSKFLHAKSPGQRITLEYDNGKKETFDLQDNNGIQTLSPTVAGETGSITLRVDEIYRDPL